MNSDMSAPADIETAALDDLVYGELTAEQRAFESIAISVGTSMDAKSARAALLRLQEAGKADLTYGLGWRRTVAEL